MTCPWCGSTVTKRDSGLGALGALFWFRCRYCGGQFSKRVLKRKRNK
jgi:hypothetical protein